MSVPANVKPATPPKVKSVITTSLKILAASALFALLLNYFGGENEVASQTFLLAGGILALVFGILIGPSVLPGFIRDEWLVQREYLVFLIFIVGWVVFSLGLSYFLRGFFVGAVGLMYAWFALLNILPGLYLWSYRNIRDVPPKTFAPVRYQTMFLPMNYNLTRTGKGLRWIIFDVQTATEEPIFLREIRCFLTKEHAEESVKNLFRLSVAHQISQTNDPPDFSTTQEACEWSFFRKPRQDTGIDPDLSLELNKVQFATPTNKELNVDRSELPEGFKWVTICAVRHPIQNLSPDELQK